MKSRFCDIKPCSARSNHRSPLSRDSEALLPSCSCPNEVLLTLWCPRHGPNTRHGCELLPTAGARQVIGYDTVHVVVKEQVQPTQNWSVAQEMERGQVGALAECPVINAGHTCW